LEKVRSDIVMLSKGVRYLWHKIEEMFLQTKSGQTGAGNQDLVVICT